MTRELFREDGYQQVCEATITGIGENWVELDQTIFYPTGGGQPGDVGVLVMEDGRELSVIGTEKGPNSGQIVHELEEAPSKGWVGQPVKARIDWDRRHRLMRMHTCLHLLCSLIDAPVTGGSIRGGSGRLDFDLPESNLDKTALTDGLNALIEADHAVASRWISDEELAAAPELVRTMSVQPPSGEGQVRLMDIEGVDLQPCGGTHVAQTGEIGRVRVKKIEKKGRQNRRVNIVLED